MAVAQGEWGEVVLRDHFAGPEMPVATASAYGAQYSAIGPFRVTGDLVETDTGVVGLAKAGGYIRISGNNEDGKGVFVGTETILSPALNGTLVLECRCEMAALTARNVWVGFMATNADDVAEPVTGSTVTLTYVDTVVAGFMHDSQLTSQYWHMPYKGGSATSPTASTSVVSTALPVLAESDLLRIEIDPNGTARWYINGKLEQTVVGAVSTTTLLSAGAGVWGTTTTAADLDIDYLLVRYNTDWTR